MGRQKTNKKNTSTVVVFGEKNNLQPGAPTYFVVGELMFILKG